MKCNSGTSAGMTFTDEFCEVTINNIEVERIYPYEVVEWNSQGYEAYEFDNINDANDHAIYLWYNLTPKERKSTRIYVDYSEIWIDNDGWTVNCDEFF